MYNYAVVVAPKKTLRQSVLSLYSYAVIQHYTNIIGAFKESYKVGCNIGSF